MQSREEIQSQLRSMSQEELFIEAYYQTCRANSLMDCYNRLKGYVPMFEELLGVGKKAFDKWQKREPNPIWRG